MRAGYRPDTLSKVTESIDGSDTEHTWTENNDALVLAIGDMLYVSGFGKFTSGQREGIKVTLENNTAFSNHSETSVEFNIKRGTVITETGAVLRSGIEIQDDGAYEFWFLTPQADTADAASSVRWTLMQETSPTTMTDSYTGDGSYLHVGGVMAVPLPFYGPHNLLHGRDYEGNVYWSQSLLTPTNADLAWSGGIYPDFARLTDSVDASDVPHLMNSGAAGNTTPIKMKVGDRLFVEFYVAYTAGQIDGVVLWNSNPPALNVLFGNRDLSFYFDLSQGAEATNAITSAFETREITEVDTNIYRIRLTSFEATSDFEFAWLIASAQIDGAGAADISYTGAGNYFHITGFRAVTLPNAGADVRLGYSENDAGENNKVCTGNLALSEVSSGPYTIEEDLSFSSTVFGQALAANVVEGESDSTLSDTYTALAVSIATGASAPTGSGAVRGVWVYNGKIYCFRDNTGATEGQMFEATSGGWSLVTLNDRLSFDAGDNNTPQEGDTVTGATSGASAPIRRVVLTSGTWGVDAAGYFILGTVTSGPFQDNEQLEISAARIADADGANAAQTLPAGGRYEFRNNNFYGASDDYRMYGVNGVGLGFEFDNTSGEQFFCEIETGMATDTPKHLAVHNYHLFYGFPGGSVQLSGDGDPVSWTVITGATEIAVGDEITGFNEEVGNSLFIFTRNRSYVLQGNTRANFDLDDFNINSGAHEWSVDRIGLGCFFDDRGFTTLAQTQRADSVNFLENTVSELIQPLVKDLAENQQVKCAHLIRSSNIYRCYFDDGRIVSIGFDNNRVTGHMPLEYPFIANCAVSGENSTGAEELYVGADDGVVYKLETGTSFDGDPIRAFVRTVLHHSKSPGRLKKYAQARLDATLRGALTLTGQLEYDFGDPDWNLADQLDFSTDTAGSYWDDFTWDNYVWDKQTSGIPQVKIEGEGTNVAVYLESTSSTDNPHTLRGITLQWHPRRTDRRN